MSFTIFHYVEDLQWTTGDINGGTNGLGGEEAQVGFNSGGGSHFSLPESQTANVLMLDTTSNVRLPGVWVFQVDGSNITSGASKSIEYFFEVTASRCLKLLLPGPIVQVTSCSVSVSKLECYCLGFCSNKDNCVIFVVAFDYTLEMSETI